MLSQYRYLLEQIVAAPNEPLRTYSLVPPDSRRRFPDPAIELPEPSLAPIPLLFATQAQRPAPA